MSFHLFNHPDTSSFNKHCLEEASRQNNPLLSLRLALPTLARKLDMRGNGPCETLSIAIPWLFYEQYNCERTASDKGNHTQIGG
jgi:hypothetical protein